ncbi:hypothetical protein [Pedobacter nototheniae]|uniref:hypothetical protein n=1 Tax=Pedobacter nototheniae TaxID=2488994 RepID=UPI00103E5426|nr:hypothetical protein [Pedobacter nototheniae]
MKKINKLGYNNVKMVELLKKISKIIFVSILFNVSVLAQTVPTKVNFSTPEVTAFNRSMETPVSLYTGVPNISIPLYEINIKGVSVPIKLDYHAGGVRVDQEATWVGLGWNLSYGGEISRKTRGIPDEYYYFEGLNNSALSVNSFMQMPNIGSPDFTTSIQNQRIEAINLAKFGGSDYMPDEFYYSALGYSGRFMFSQNQNRFIMYPKDDITVSKFDGPLNSFGSPKKLFFWNLKLPNGVSIDFGKEGSTSFDMQVMNLNKRITNSWKIRAIKNNYNDSISYSYENYDYSIYKINGQKYKINTWGSDGSTSISNPILGDSYLKTITFPGGRLECSVSLRADMPGKALSEINVYDNFDKIIKTIKFNYSYFSGSAFDVLGVVDPFGSVKISDDYRYKRLKLESISIIAPKSQPLNYIFDYYSVDKIPSKYSFSQDHYGFYNGMDNVKKYGFIPNLDPKFVGGDRSVKPEYSQVFSLKSIIYPEGGKTEYVYENNTAGLWGEPNELLATYQDDNFIEKRAAISVSSYSRRSNYPDPDEIKNGIRYFRKKFTISGSKYNTTSNNWTIYTNFGISELEKNTPYYADNVQFTLEKINLDNSRTLVRTFNTTQVDYPSGTSSLRNGTDEGFVNLTGGDYEMTVAMTYLNQANTPADNQPYNLSFVVKWRELDKSTKRLNVGGLRIKNINYYTSENNLAKRKGYLYVNPYADATISNFSSGRIVSLPQYIQYKMVTSTVDISNIYKNVNFSIDYSSNSIIPLESTSGSFTGYEYVDEYDIDFQNEQNNTRTNNRFSYDQAYFSQYHKQNNTWIYEPKEWARGKLLDKTYYKGGAPIKKEIYEYYFVSPYAGNVESAEDYVEEINTDFISFQSYVRQYLYSASSFPEDFYDSTGGVDGIEHNCVYFYYSPFNNHIMSNQGVPTSGGIPSLTCDYYTNVPYFKRYTGFDKLKSKVTTSYDNPLNPLVQTENYTYDKTPVHYQLTKTTSISSTGTALSSENKYPQDLSLTGSEEIARLNLISNHQLNQSLEQTTEKNSVKQISRTDYAVDPLTGLTLPKVLKTNTRTDGGFEDRSVYNKFDHKANLLEIQQSSGTKLSYVYSYNTQYPIAEIKNADYATVENVLGGATVVNNFSNSNPTDAEVKAFLVPLRNGLPDAQITTFTYKPLVGMTSQTDPKGLTTYYEYDEFQRLKNVKDQNGNIIKNNTYHYKN